MTEQVSDAVGDSAGRETKEAVEDAVGDTTGGILDDFDEYEQFYEDLLEQQRETCREYEDFLDDLRELQRERMGEGLDIPLPDSSMKDAVGNAVAEGGSNTIKTVNGYDAKVNGGQQNKHIPGTNEYQNALNNGQAKSILYGDTNDIQSLLIQKAGTGDFLGINKERVDFGKVIGQYIHPETKIGVETTKGIIHYRKKEHA